MKRLFAVLTASRVINHVFAFHFCRLHAFILQCMTLTRFMYIYLTCLHMAMELQISSRISVASMAIHFGFLFALSHVLLCFFTACLRINNCLIPSYSLYIYLTLFTFGTSTRRF